ncbi:MAG TPA: molybdate ABC transporter permease subunit [Acidobacteriota bacterium]|nr:molybdate ABC transporter permease subunit [Acidobacteriota bacterium]
MDDSALTALLLSLQVASLATLLVLLPGVPLAYLLARFEFRGKGLLSGLVGLPLVLPPTAVGYLLLEAFSEDGILGRDSLGFDPGILLTWKGAVVASGVMAMPLVVRTARVTFEGVDPRLEMMARTLGHGRLATFVSYTLPLSFKGLLAAAILGFTRAIGEFGATVTIAGNIPGRTQTLASAIFSAQQVGADREAYFLLAVSLAVGLTSILISEHLVRDRLAGASKPPSGGAR